MFRNLTTHQYSAPIMLSAITLILLMFVWAFNSGQQLLRQQAPLIDTVMQLRLDLSQAHLLTDEHTASNATPTDKAMIMASLKKISQQVDKLAQGQVEIGQVHSIIQNNPQFQSQIREFKQSLHELSTYLDKNYDQFQKTPHHNLSLDRYFTNSSILAEQFDQTVHHNIAQALDRQSSIFSLQLAFALLFITALFIILRLHDRKAAKAEQQLTLLSQALTHSGESMMIVNAKGIIEFTNYAFQEMTGFKQAEALGNKPSIISSGKQNKPFYNHLWKTIKSGKVWRGELTNKKKNGDLYPALMTIAPIFNQQGQLSHFVGNQRNMSEYKALENQLLQAHKLEAIGTLAGGIAHDFNNALTGITGNIYLLKRHPDDQEKILKRCNSIKQICDSASTHIKQLLSYARNDSVIMSSIDLNRSILNACQMAHSVVPDQVDMKFISHADILYVYWNETQVQQILINLINNALHALQATPLPSLIIEVQIIANSEELMRRNYDMTDEQYICISIQDNGSGMTRDVSDRVFEPFFTTKIAGEGTGLGLSMAYGAVKQAGGDLSVASELGQGTTFKLLLPIDNSLQEGSAVVSNTTYQGQGQTILIAEDEPHLLRTQQFLLESFGYKVLTCCDGQEALNCFQEHGDHISLVLLDLVMPGLTGMQAAKEILKITPDMPIVLTTGYDRDNSISESNKDIQAPLIYKPYKPEAMSKLIYDQLQAHPQTRTFQFNI